MKNLLIAVTLSIAAATSTAVSSPATPWRHVVTSEDKFFFVMDPGNFDDVLGKGVAYKSKRNGVEKLWEVSGWYAAPGNVFLSRDGKTLVRVVGGVPYLKDESKLPQEEVLFFYRKGKLKKSYMLSELIKNLKTGLRPNMFTPERNWLRDMKLEPSEWYRIVTDPEGAIGTVQHPDVFQLTTLEGAHFVFDLKDGNLLTKGFLKEEQSTPTVTDDVDPFADVESQAEQGGAEQTTSAPESEPEGDEKSK